MSIQNRPGGAGSPRLMLTEFLPIQIALKTLAPIIFGGVQYDQLTQIQFAKEFAPGAAPADAVGLCV